MLWGFHSAFRIRLLSGGASDCLSKDRIAAGDRCGMGCTRFCIEAHLNDSTGIAKRKPQSSLSPSGVPPAFAFFE